VLEVVGEKAGLLLYGALNRRGCGSVAVTGAHRKGDAHLSAARLCFLSGFVLKPPHRMVGAERAEYAPALNVCKSLHDAARQHSSWFKRDLAALNASLKVVTGSKADFFPNGRGQRYLSLFLYLDDG
jgi:hypothetical protein